MNTPDTTRAYRIDYQKGDESNPFLDRYRILQMSNGEYIAEAWRMDVALHIVAALEQWEKCQ